MTPTETLDLDVRGAEEAAAAQTTAIEAQARAEIDIQVATARRFPRSLKRFQVQAEKMATASVEIAASCLYAKPVAGGVVRGPSIRLAEIIASTYCNLRVNTQVLDVGAEFVTVRGFAWDLENNSAFASTVTRRIVDRNGKRYNESGIENALAAGQSIARRGAIYQAVPRLFVDRLYAAAKAIAVGEGRPMGERIDFAFSLFAKAGVTEDRVLRAVGVESRDEITAEHLETLQGFRTAMREEGAAFDPEAVFPRATAPVPQKKQAPGPPKQDEAQPPSTRKRRGRPSKKKPAAQSAADSDSSGSGNSTGSDTSDSVPSPVPDPHPAKDEQDKAVYCSVDELKDIYEAMMAKGTAEEDLNPDLTVYLVEIHDIASPDQIPASLLPTIHKAIEAGDL